MMPLEGIRVLDLSRLAPGPFCTMLLGDLGADVIVVEAPPDAMRSGLRVEQVIDADALERGAAFNALGRNKRSIILNLRQDAARDVFYRLAATADVVLEGFRPGVVKRLCVDYETLRDVNPRLVYCSLSGYGQRRPLLRRRRPRHQLHRHRRHAGHGRLAGRAAGDSPQRRRRLRRRRPARRLRHPGGAAGPRQDGPRPVPRHRHVRRRHVPAGRRALAVPGERQGGASRRRACSTAASPTTTSTRRRTVAG